MLRHALPLLLFLIPFVVGDCARSQCSMQWGSGTPRPALAGSGECATSWDPDGAGPLPVRLVVGGSDLVAGSAAAGQRVMTWDGTEWQALGNGPGTAGLVLALTEWNGQLIAGGSFTGGGANFLATWNGTAWQPLGAGLPTSVRVLGTWNGLLVAATSSPTAVHTWNGVAWTTLPVPPQLSSPRAMVSYQGLLCIAGFGPAFASGTLDRWNGTSWLSPIVAQDGIECLAVRTSLAVGGTDLLYAAGNFLSIHGTTAARIASTSGGAAFAFSQVGNGLSSQCLDLHVRSFALTGTAVVAATFNAPTVLQLNSSGTFIPMGSEPLRTLFRHGGSYHGLTAPGLDVLRRYDGTDWVPVQGAGIVGEVLAATTTGNDMIVGGTLHSVPGGSMNLVARLTGSTLSPLGVGLSGNSVDALLTLDNGDVIAAGDFHLTGSSGPFGVARWNGSTWSSLSSGPFNLALSGPALALAKMPNGDLVVGGTFAQASGANVGNVARWNGTAWSSLGTGTNGAVRAFAVRSDGALFAGGTFTSAGGVACSNIAQWDGTVWQPVGSGCSGAVHALAVRPGGDIVAAGEFTTAGGVVAHHIARWTGTTWLSMNAVPGTTVFPRALAVLPNGDVIADRGLHQSSPPDAGISRWNGAMWSGIGSGLVKLASSTTDSVRAMALRANGDLLVGGAFDVAGGLAAGNLAVLSSTCPATAVSYGSGCSSAAGPLVIAADTLPWLGASFRTTTTGVAANSLCLGAIGFTQVSIPLASLLAEGQPGCTLLTAPDITFVLQSSPGTAHSAFALANAPSLLGATFFQQTIPLEFSVTGALTSVRGSNALAATIGTL